MHSSAQVEPRSQTVHLAPQSFCSTPHGSQVMAHFPGEAFQSASTPGVEPVPQLPVFTFVFLNNRIKKCYGCSQEFCRRYDGKLLPPPHDLVIQHEDRREYIRGGKKCYSPRPQNTYYHPSMSCVRSKYPSFNSSYLCLDKVRGQLSVEHTQFIKSHFGIAI